MTAVYQSLVMPGIESSPRYFASVQDDMYNSIVMKFMQPSDMHHMGM
jgi:hypothetical protein